jgi:HK97 family phage major capsid protein
VTTNEVTLVVEGDSVSVEHVPEAGTKPISTGNVSQKVSTVFKAAGISEVSDELLMDTASGLEPMIARQFNAATFELIDRTIIAGTGVGEPTGLLHTAGVTQTPVSAQDGVALFEAVITAHSGIVADFYMPTVIAMRPELVPRFLLDAKASTGQYLYPGGATRPLSWSATSSRSITSSASR